ncbi:MAG: TonB-dependent receptor [Gammaproteobacteria bacterium]|nr:TonB-dependent receptor [Gammaproteobacteria bacterium]
MMKQPHLGKTLLSAAICLFGSAQVLAAKADGKSLEEVAVIGQKQPYRGDTPLESLPQQVQVMSGDLLVELGKMELQGALDMAGGVARQNSFGGLWDSFAIRGFAGDENLPSGYLINGFSGGRGFSGNRDASNIETIEILKGPGSALYGRSEPGGTINIVTKKPQFEREGYIRTSAGRYDTYRVEGDFTDKLSDKVAFRINGAYQDANSFRDTVESEKLSLTPSFLFVLSDSTSLSYELEYLSQKAPFDRGIVAIDGDPEVLPVSRFLGEPGDGPTEITAVGHQAVLQHDFAGGWSILAGAGARSSSFEGCSSGAELSGGRQLLDDDGMTLVRQPRCRDYDADDLSGRIELTGTFNTGPFTHHLLVGADAYEYELESIQDRFRVAFGTGDTTYAINVFNPVYGQTRPPLSPQTNNLEEQSAKGIYLQDQIDLSAQWKMLIGIRYDDFDQDIHNRLRDTRSKQSQTKTSPRFGLVFEPTNNLSLYASYSEGFRPNSGADFDGNAFEPEDSKSYELGVKWTSPNGMLNSTVALFKAEKSNIITSDPVNQGFSAALGEAESKGIEIDLTGELSESLRLMFSYAYVDAATTNDVVNADWGVPIPAGSPLINIPEHSGNLMLVKSFEIGGAASTAGISVNYVDDRLGETIDPTYVLPSYTLVNLFGSYQASQNLKLSLNIDNVTDEKYYVSSYHKWWTTPGSPMTYTVGAQYSF